MDMFIGLSSESLGLVKVAHLVGLYDSVVCSMIKASPNAEQLFTPATNDTPPTSPRSYSHHLASAHFFDHQTRTAPPRYHA
jgi:hypothetical protein